MQNKTKLKIGIFDSGMGGTTIFRAIKSTLKNAEYLYIADSKNCPYGEKTDEELKEIVTKNVETLKSWGAKIIVIACNTATVKCIDYLRKTYPEIDFIGTEPAIKLATKTNKKNILVLATPGTVKSERTQKLIAENQNPTQKITLLPCPGLADTIERTVKFTKDYEPLPLSESQEDIIENKLADLFKNIDLNPDVIVLGCTHYPLIKTEIQEFFKGATLLDGSDGVARRTISLANKKSTAK